MSVDNLTALAARDELLWIARNWTALRARLRPGGGNALGVAVTTSDEPAPIDVHVSDLLHEITERVARFYGHILLDEVPPDHGCDGACRKTKPPTPAADCPQRVDPITTSTMPGLLRQVAMRYGHFTKSDQAMALGFCDDAHEYHEKVRKTLERPAPATYLGPCQGDNCGGELYVREGRDLARCRECGKETTLAEQRAWLDERMADRLMTATELGKALKILGYPTDPRTVWRWIEKERLVPVVKDEGLYRLTDAEALAKRRAA